MQKAKRLTRKAIISAAKHVVAVPYCRADKTIKDLPRVGYYANAYGWRCDVYRLADDVTLTTGYVPIGTDLPQELHNAAAEEVVTWARGNA